MSFRLGQLSGSMHIPLFSYCRAASLRTTCSIPERSSERCQFELTKSDRPRGNQPRVKTSQMS
jgi:hypothetical protein